jgi:hypothetical protein
VQAITWPKKSALVDFNILINFQHLNEGRDEKATAVSGLSRIEVCNFFLSGSLFHACECYLCHISSAFLYRPRLIGKPQREGQDLQAKTQRAGNISCGCS